MKKYLLTASLIAGLSMISAPAMAQASGHVGARFGNVEVDAGGLSGDDNLIGVDGAVAFPAGSGMLFQLDGAFLSADEADVETLLGSAHLGVRNDTWAAGGYIGITDNDADNGVFYGGEFVYYMPQLSLSAGVGAGSFDDSDTDLFGVSGEGRYFISDNFRLDGRVGILNIDDGFAEDDGFSYGIGGEWKPDSFPVSFFAGADFANFDDSDVDITMLQVGVRFDFGNGTLKARDRNGPAFKALSGFSEAGLF